MIARYTSGGAGGTVNQASGDNEKPGPLMIGAVLAAAYAVYKVMT